MAIKRSTPPSKTSRPKDRRREAVEFAEHFGNFDPSEAAEILSDFLEIVAERAAEQHATYMEQAGHMDRLREAASA
jgi:DNA-directed RNA polymerase subunit F